MTIDWASFTPWSALSVARSLGLALRFWRSSTDALPVSPVSLADCCARRRARSSGGAHSSRGSLPHSRSIRLSRGHRL